MLTIEQSIVNQLINNDEYYALASLIVKQEYFKDVKVKNILRIFQKIISEKDRRPSLQDISYYIEQEKDISQDLYTDMVKEIYAIFKEKDTFIDHEILLTQTLKFCKERAYQNALLDGMECLKAGKNLYGAIEKMENALSIDIDDDLGFDLFDRESAEKRFEKYRDINTIKSGFKPWDDFTGGLEPSTLNIIQAPTNGGKSLTMAYLAVLYALQGYNVLYVTCEMADYKISMRQEAALMDQEMDMFRRQITNKDQYLELFDAMCKFYPNHGAMRIKEYPTGEATHLTIKNHVKRLKTSKKFIPDIIVVDYLMILNTTKKVSFDNLYAFQMAIAIELRGMAQTFKIPVLSAMQMTRESLKAINKDQEKANVGIEDMSGSIGVAFTIDQLITQVPLRPDKCTQYLTEDIKSVYMWINSKTRNSGTKDEKVFVGVNGGKMKLYEIDNNNESSSTIINTLVTNKLDEDINDWVEEFNSI